MREPFTLSIAFTSGLSYSREASPWNWYRSPSAFITSTKFRCVYRSSIYDETIASSFFNPDAGRNFSRGFPTTFPREMSRLPCVSDSSSSFVLTWTAVPFQHAVSSKDTSSSSSSFSSSRHLHLRRCSKPSIRFLDSLVSCSCYSLPLSLCHATLKLAFSLLSSEAADFPHFTFQSHGGCDFLAHFHSDNIEEASTSDEERRRKFHNFVDSISHRETENE